MRQNIENKAAFFGIYLIFHFMVMEILLVTNIVFQI